MSKRFVGAKMWDEDWFLELPNEYKLLWYYIISKCDFAGFWKPNKYLLESFLKTTIDLKKAIDMFNKDKERIKVINNDWFIIDFIVYQYGHKLNEENRVHKAIIKVLSHNGVELTSIRGLNEVTHTLKEKEKDIDKDISVNKGIVKGEENIQLDKQVDVRVKEIIDFLNKQTGMSFEHNATSTKRFILARLNEGRTVEDMKIVILYKCGQWLKDEKFSQFLRPKTLFNATNFDNYIVESKAAYSAYKKEKGENNA